MASKKMTEKKSISIIEELLEYLSFIDNGSINRIIKSGDEESYRDNVGWYQYVDDKHIININVPNIMYYNRFVEDGRVDLNSYYAFLSLCICHEFRHFMQGRCIFENQEIDGYGQKDVLNAQLMLYIRYFFDGYYQLNKGYVKYEEDAEKFAVITSRKFLSNKYPDMNVDKAIVDAVNLIASLQSRGGMISTLPTNNENIGQIIEELNNRINDNKRITPLNRTLFVYNSRFYSTHVYFRLDEDGLLTKKLIDEYGKIKDGSKQDLLVAKAILSKVEKKEESLEEFPKIMEDYKNKKLIIK